MADKTAAQQYGLSMEIRYVPDLGWHWRVWTTKVDWSGTVESLRHAVFSACGKAKEVAGEIVKEFPSEVDVG